MFKKFSLIMLLIGLTIFAQGTGPVTAQAAGKQYGVLIGDSKGNYTFYDFNGIEGEQKIEISKSGSIMVPLKLLCGYMPDINYSFDAGTRKAVLVNKKNGRKVVLTENSKTAYSYTRSSAKGTKRGLVYKTYVASDSNAAMAHMAALKWVMANGDGCKYFNKNAIINAGYDSGIYSGIIVYNPYKKVTALPKAADVTYRTRTNDSHILKVTIPEGYSMAQIFELLVKKGVCASTISLFEAAEKYDFSKYPLIGQLEADENRCFLLEGYLYPDTYEFYRNSRAEDVIARMVNNTEKRITAANRQAAAVQGYTVDEILTIASIIEKETGDINEMPRIASVLRNRLSAGQRLQCDATIHYIERYVKPYITGDINRYNAYYNTYKCPALPKGPICSPGRNAVLAALNPEDTDYLFFVTDAQGSYYYASTYEEHLANIKLAGLNDTEQEE